MRPLSVLLIGAAMLLPRIVSASLDPPETSDPAPPSLAQPQSTSDERSHPSTPLPAGASALAAIGSALLSPPQIDSIVPHVGVGPEVNAVVYGNGFFNPAVRLERPGKTIIGQVMSYSSTAISVRFLLPAGHAGSWVLRVYNENFEYATLLDYQTVLSSPNIDSIVPALGVGPVTNTVIYGSGFYNSPAVSLQRPGDSVTGVVTSFSPTVLGVRFSLSPTNAPGTWDVRVANSDDGADTLLASYQTVRSSPQADSIVPNVGVGPSADAVIHGSGFYDPASVRLQRPGDSLVGQVTSFSPTAIGVRFTPSAANAPGVWDVRVANSDGGADTMFSAYTTVLSSPHIDSIVPSKGGGAEANVVVYGQGFSSSPQVRLSRPGEIVVGFVTSSSATAIGVRFFLTFHGPGIWDVVEVNSDGGSVTLHAGYETLPPRVDSISPTSGCGGQAVVRVRGDLFLTPTVRLVRPGSTITGAPGAWSPTTIDVTFNISGQPSATWDVVVRNSNGGADTLPSGFRTVNGPLLASSGPPEAPDSGGVTLLIAGQCMASGLASELVRAGEPAIPGTQTVVAANGRSFTAVYDVRNRPGTYDLRAWNPSGDVAVLPAALEVLDLLAVDEDVVRTTGLTAVAPNPARSRARIEWSLAREGPVSITVHDLQGRQVAVLVDGSIAAGRHEVTWDARVLGRSWSAGLYFVRFTAEARREVRRLVLVP